MRIDDVDALPVPHLHIDLTLAILMIARNHLAVFERAEWPCLRFIEHSYAGDSTNRFIPNRAATEAMFRRAGFQIEHHPEREVYWCRRADAEGAAP